MYSPKEKGKLQNASFAFGFFTPLIFAFISPRSTDKRVSILTKYFLDCLEFCGFTINIDINLKLEKPIFFNADFGILCNTKDENCIELKQMDAEGLVQLLSGGMDELNDQIKTSKNLLKLVVTFFELKVDDRLAVIHKFI